MLYRPTTEPEVQSLLKKLIAVLPITLNGPTEFVTALQQPATQVMLHDVLISLCLRSRVAPAEITKQWETEELERRAYRKMLFDQERVRAQVLVKMFCQPSTIVGDSADLQLRINKIMPDLQLNTTVLANRNWEHIFSLNEETYWIWSHENYWHERNLRQVSGAESLLIIDPEQGVLLERDS